MDALTPFLIPVKGLQTGVHAFDFEIDSSFFACFDHSPIQECSIVLKAVLEKRSSFYLLDISFEGTVQTECDRCLALIDLPVSAENRLLVKLSLEPAPEEADVVYVSPEIQQLDISKYVYDFVVLSVPLVRTFDCEEQNPRPCNTEMLYFLDEMGPEEQDTNNIDIDSVWEELKNWKNNLN